MPSDIMRELKQLKKKELLKLAKKKNARDLNDKNSKSELVKILSHFVNQKEIQSLLPSGGTGKDAVISGNMFEKKCMNYFVKKGYDCKQNVTKIKGMEFDIVGVKNEKGLFSSTEKFIIAECKNRPKVIMQDFDKFLGKYNHFIRKFKAKAENGRGFIMTSGIFDPVVKNTARHHPEIKLLRI